MMRATAKPTGHAIAATDGCIGTVAAAVPGGSPGTSR